MQLNHFSNKNLKSTHLYQFPIIEQSRQITSTSFIQLPVPANQPRPSSPPVEIIKEKTIVSIKAMKKEGYAMVYNKSLI